MVKNNIFTIILDIIGQIVGFLVFILIVFILNFLTLYIKEPIFIEIVQFINQNIYLICIITIFLIVAELLNKLFIPISLLAPIFFCIGYLYLFIWITKIICFVNSKLNLNICHIFLDLKYLFYIIIIVLVIIGWYISIFAKTLNKEKQKRRKK
jgi:hypothetical protein